LSHLCPPSTNKPYDSVPINFEIYGRVIPGWFVNHHQAHAASTYYTSNFDEAAVFTMDATDNNPWVCSLFSYGYKNKLETLYYPGIQIGHAYSQFTEMLGIGHAIFKAGRWVWQLMVNLIWMLLKILTSTPSLIGRETREEMIGDGFIDCSWILQVKW
jgi:hypothetical protein